MGRGRRLASWRAPDRPRLRQGIKNAFTAAFKDSGLEGYVTHYSDKQLAGMKLYTSGDGKAGVAVHDHGDGRIEATALFNNGGAKGVGLKLLAHVVKTEGVNYAECYGPKLNELYRSTIGFEVVTSDAFNPEFASPSWNHARDDSPNYYTMRRRSSEFTDSAE